MLLAPSSFVSVYLVAPFVHVRKGSGFRVQGSGVFGFMCGRVLGLGGFWGLDSSPLSKSEQTERYDPSVSF